MNNQVKYLIILFFLPLALCAQTEKSDKKSNQPPITIPKEGLKKGEEVFRIPITQPYFYSEKCETKNGTRAKAVCARNELVNFLGKNLKYPKKAMKKKIEGKVIVGFTVEADGEITNIKVLKSVSKILDKEALRVVKMMPNWVPGTFKGKNCPTPGKKLPFNFNLPKSSK